MADVIIIRARKQPYVGFAVILGPIIALTVYAAIRSGVMSTLIFTAVSTLVLFLIYLYLSTFKLMLTESAIVYKQLWQTKKIPINSVASLEPGPKLFGVQGWWAIHLRTGEEPINFNIANFSGSELKRFTAALLKVNPTIRILV
jgi:hypothetical protein